MRNPRPFRLLLALPSAVATEIGDYIQQGISPLQLTGSGDAYASSCQSALWEWKASSSAYGLSHTTSSLTTAPRYPTGAPSVSASSVTVLCDGYSRAVGSASFISLRHNESTTYTAVGLLAPYPTPAPCSINQYDCSKLYSSYSTASSSLIGSNTTLLAPACNTNGSSSISFSSAYCVGNGLNGVVGVRGSAVQLLYWPLRTSDNPAYFCTQTVYSDLVTPITIPGTRTGSGPNTFVTGTLTITSPTIALSYSGLSRIDGCGTTIEHTIITMRPEQLTSVRGDRSLYDHRPFNYGDLNWMCPSASNSSHFTVQDLQGPDCYQNVPAQAYWQAPQYFNLAMYANVSQIQQWTMVNNYMPYVMPGPDVWSDTLQSLWGTSASWFIDGSWDPPIALSEAASVAKPTLPASYSARPTSESSKHPLATTTTVPTPAHLSDTLPSLTTEPQYTQSSAPGSSLSNAGYVDSSPTQAKPPASASLMIQESNLKSGDSSVMIDIRTLPVSWTSMWDGSNPMVILGSETLSVGGPPHTFGGHIVSAAPTGLVVDNVDSTSSVHAQDFVKTTSHTSSDSGAMPQNDGNTNQATSGGLATVAAGSLSSTLESSRGTTTLKATSDGNSGVEPLDATSSAAETSRATCLSVHTGIALLAALLILAG